VALSAAIAQRHPALAQSRSAEEAALKVAFLYNFATFSESRAEGDAEPYRLCVFGTDSLDQALDTLTGKSIHGRPLSAIHVTQAKALRQCQVVYIEDIEGQDLTNLVKSLAGDAVLTVGLGDNFTESGGIIALIRKDNRFGFTINSAAATRAGIKLSSKLLSLAVMVRE
jgi:hypothetical protein